MPISQDEQERLEGTRIAEMLEKTSIWSQESIDSREPHKDDFDRFVNCGYATDKEDYINRYVLSARLARDKHKLELNRTYKLIDPTDKYEQLATLSFDKKDFRPSMINALVASLRRKCPKPIDYDTAIIRPEFNASSQDDPSFNPHVHIYTPKVQKASAVANALNKRFVSCKNKVFPIYNANVVEAPAPSHRNYILGLKSSTEKNEKLEADAAYREKHDIQELYHISQK